MFEVLTNEITHGRDTVLIAKAGGPEIVTCYRRFTVRIQGQAFNFAETRDSVTHVESGLRVSPFELGQDSVALVKAEAERVGWARMRSALAGAADVRGCA